MRLTKYNPKGRGSRSGRKARTNAHLRPAAEYAHSFEARLVHLAASGSLARAAQKAIRKQLARGFPITFKRGNRVIKQYPDGQQEILAELERPAYTLPPEASMILDK